MFEKNDKKRLYWLIEMYLSGNIDASTFCDEFYYSYSLEINDDTLSEIEQYYFSQLDKVSSRFTKFEEDLTKYAGVYYNEEELRQKVLETKEALIDSGIKNDSTVNQ